MSETKKSSNRWVYAIIILVFVGLCGKAVEKAANSSTPTASEGKDSTSFEARREAALKEVDSMDKPPTEADQIQEVKQFIDSFKVADLNAQAPYILLVTNNYREMAAKLNVLKDSPENGAAAKATLTKLQAKANKDMPQLRAKWGKVAANTMWEHDIEVDVIGSNKDIIVFTGGTFAANKNIKDFNDNLSEALTTLRFKQSRYKWYSGDEEYTYYTFKHSGDKLE